MGLREWLNSLFEQPRPLASLDDDVPQITQARRNATAHAQAGDYSSAIADLERVREFETAGGSEPEFSSEIRRAKYLQKGGRGDEAWRVYRQLMIRCANDPWTMVDVFDAMRLHLQREGQAGEAIPYGVAHRLARIKLYREWRREALTALSGPLESYGIEKLDHMISANRQSEIDLSDTWLRELTDPAEVRKLASSLCKKAGVPHRTNELAEHISGLIAQQIGPFHFLQMEEIVP